MWGGHGPPGPDPAPSHPPLPVQDLQLGLESLDLLGVLGVAGPVLT